MESIISQLELDKDDQSGLSKMYVIETLLEHYAPEVGPLANCLITTDRLGRVVLSNLAEIGPLRIDAPVVLPETSNIVYKNIAPEVSNGVGNDVGNIITMFTPPVDGDYVVDYSGMLQSGTGGITLNVGSTQIFVAAPSTGGLDGGRLSLTRQENFTPPLNLQAGIPVTVTQWAGGGGLVLNHTVCVRLDEPADPNANTGFDFTFPVPLT